MDFYEFRTYLEENCRAKQIFFSKMTTYLQRQVASSENKIYLNSSQIESEVKRAWNTAVQNVYNTVKPKVKTRKTDAPIVKREKWIAEMSELETLDNFTEELDNMEID
ncbi:hypothetical protein [Lactococcus lactis]|uniref:hypothetical protein n=1 Tax=Lactococcus lactis TaxID=1358 RepID=UPI001F57CC0C|nr:hypothetical protein [Lactococcus lactis]